MAKRDYYEVLGIDKSASQEDIKKAYRKIAMANHPDTHPNDKSAEERFKEASEAYEVLSDPKKKSAYDQFGFSGVDGFAGGAAGNYSNVYRDFSDIFGGGGFGDFFSSFFGGGSSGRTQNSPQTGDSFRYDLVLTFKEACFGCKKEISITRKVMCPECHGTGGIGRKECPTCHGTGRTVSGNGFFQMANTCRTCGGKGFVIDNPCQNCRGTSLVSKKERLSVNIPAGIENGARLTLRGKGDDGTNGGPSGDLILFITVRNDRYFVRDGLDLHVRIPITVTKAILGGTVTIEGPDGSPISLTIPPSAESGNVITLRGKGIAPKGRIPGNLNVHIFVTSPKHLSSKAKKLVEELSSEIKEEDRPKPMEFGK